MRNGIFFIIVVCVFALLGCDNESKENSNSVTLLALMNGGGKLTPSQNIYLNDASGEVGRVLEVDEFSIKLYSSEGYIYNINWVGELLNIIYPTPLASDLRIYYTGTNCTGSAYYDDAGWSLIGYPLKGKTIIWGRYLGVLYKPQTVNSDGTAQYVVGPIAYSSYDSLGFCSNASSNIDYGIPLTPVTRASVGIPATITPPLTLVFK